MPQLHLVSAMYSSKGHGREYVTNFYRHLKSSFKINLFYASKLPVKENQIVPITRIAINYEKTNAEYFVRFSFMAPYIRAIYKQIQSFKYYHKILKSDSIKEGDLIFIMDYDIIPLYYLLNGLKRKGTNNYIWIHSAKFKSKDLLYTFYKLLFKIGFRKFILPNIKKIIVNGQFIKSAIQFHLNVGQDKIKIIQYPSEIRFKRINKVEARKILEFKSNENIVLFFGMLREDKNLETLIKSISQCKTQIKLLISGSESSITKNDILNWLTRYNLTNYYLDINYISEEKMALYYSCSDLLLLTYGLESSSQSGPLSLARQFNLPAVVTASGEIGHYVEINKLGFVAKENSATNIAYKIDTYFQLSHEDKKSIEDNIERAKVKYSWERAAEHYQEIFKL